MTIFDIALAGIFSFTVSPLGLMLRRNMRRESITDEELNAKIRHEGVDDFATVKSMYLEADGEMSLIRQDEPKAAP